MLGLVSHHLQNTLSHEERQMMLLGLP